jgi:hypothetical protein
MTEEVSWTDPKTWEVIHEHKKKIDIRSKFFANTTGMSYYDGLLEFPRYHKENKCVCGKIVLMSPDDYFDSCANVRSKITSFVDEMDDVNMERVDIYRQRSLKGEKMPLPVIDKKTCSQEGRHRAMTAKRLGLEKIPVLIVEEC